MTIERAVIEAATLEDAARSARDDTPARPDPSWVVGECPACGQEVVSNCYYVPGKGYIVIRQCWDSLGMEPGCSYRKVL